MKRLALTFALMSTCGAAQADEYVGNYLCLADAAGGLAPDQQSSRWQGARFDHSVIKAILKVRAGSMPDHYRATFTVTTMKTDMPCMNPPEDEVVILQTVECNTPLHAFRFNFENRKFLAAYMFAHYNDSTDTPYVAAGTCTKLD